MMRKILLLFVLGWGAFASYSEAQTVFTKLNTAPITVLTFSDPTATHNATYQYYVTAVNSAGAESAALSPTITVLASITNGPAATPAEIASNTRTIVLTWIDADSGVTFNVYRKLVAGPPVTVFLPNSPTNLTAQVH